MPAPVGCRALRAGHAPPRAPRAVQRGDGGRRAPRADGHPLRAVSGSRLPGDGLLGRSPDRLVSGLRPAQAPAVLMVLLPGGTMLAGVSSKTRRHCDRIHSERESAMRENAGARRAFTLIELLVVIAIIAIIAAIAFPVF